MLYLMSSNSDQSAKPGILSNKSMHVQNLILELDQIAENLAWSGKKIIKLHRGDPPLYFPTPKYIIDAYVEALRSGQTCYSRAQGTTELVNAVISRYKRYNMNLGRDDVIVTAGVTEALLFINNALIDKGDKAVLLRPYYPQYLVRLATEEGSPLVGRMVMAKDWSVDVDRLRKALSRARGAKRHHTKYMMITNPNNPTGTVLSKGVLKEIVDLANEYELLLVSDEIYDELVFNKAKFTSVCQLAKGVPHIILNGASKNFDATGFRVGFIIIPGEDKVSEVLKKKFSEYALTRLSVNTPAEHAVAEAIKNTKEHDIAIKSMVTEIEKRVNLVVDLLKENPYVTVTRPAGSFYIFPKLDLKSLNFADCREFITDVLIEEGIQLTGGYPFGEPNHFRIVALPPEEDLRDAIVRLNEFCRRHAR